MELVVDLDAVTVVLRDAARADVLSVVVAAPPDASASSETTVHRLNDVLESAGVGVLEPDGSASVRADALQFHAAGAVDEGWDGRFRDAWRDWMVDGGASVPAAVRWPHA